MTDKTEKLCGACGKTGKMYFVQTSIKVSYDGKVVKDLERLGTYYLCSECIQKHHPRVAKTKKISIIKMYKQLVKDWRETIQDQWLASKRRISFNEIKQEAETQAGYNMDDLVKARKTIDKMRTKTPLFIWLATLINVLGESVSKKIINLSIKSTMWNLEISRWVHTHKKKLLVILTPSSIIAILTLVLKLAGIIK